MTAALSGGVKRGVRGEGAAIGGLAGQLRLILLLHLYSCAGGLAPQHQGDLLHKDGWNVHEACRTPLRESLHLTAGPPYPCRTLCSHYFFASGAAHIGAMYTAFLSGGCLQ